MKLYFAMLFNNLVSFIDYFFGKIIIFHFD